MFTGSVNYSPFHDMSCCCECRCTGTFCRGSRTIVLTTSELNVLFSPNLISIYVNSKYIYCTQLLYFGTVTATMNYRLLTSKARLDHWGQVCPNVIVSDCPPRRGCFAQSQVHTVKSLNQLDYELKRSAPC